MSEDFLKENTAKFPSGPFMFGCSLKYIEDWVKQADRLRHLSVGNLLADTPPNWVYVKSFRIGKRMVTNGEYLKFLNAKIGDRYVYDSKELWGHVWTGLNLQIDRVTTSIMNWDGDIIKGEEDYTACGNFVEAYIDSLKFEINSLFPNFRQETEKYFKYVKYKMSDFFAKKTSTVLLENLSLEIQDDTVSIEDLKKDPKKTLEGIKGYLKKIYISYGKNVKPEQEGLFRKGEYPIESVTFLKRFFLELSEKGDKGKLSLRKIMFPRFWEYVDDGQSEEENKLLDFDTKVTWKHRIVTGISLFEAAAYTVWLSQKLGLTVRLPNEAEYEKAATWPVEDECPEQHLNPLLKKIFPWDSKKEFHFLFGQEGKEISSYYYTNRKEYENLVAETNRKCGDQGEISMLIGFGWQWTLERYDPNERRYSRFGFANYPVYSGTKYVIQEDGKEKSQKVFKYEPVDNRNFSNFIARGCPDVIGGPGLSTRRYAFYPLRGYSNIGFRYCVEVEE